MLVASEEATSGSVMQKAERMRPARSGSSQRSFCSGVPKCQRTSMLPVSGALQLKTSDATKLRPISSARGRVLERREAGPALGIGEKQVPQPLGAGPVLQGLDGGGDGPLRPVPAAAPRDHLAEMLQLDGPYHVANERAHAVDVSL